MGAYRDSAPIVEPGAGEGDELARLAAQRRFACAAAGLLKQVVAEPLFGPVGTEAGRNEQIEDVDAPFYGFDDGRL